MGTKKGITRRNFIAGASATMLAAGAASTAFADGADEEEVAYTITQTFDADIAVCGTGVSGMAAALSAAENGAKVIVVEKLTEEGVGGSSNGTSGLWGIDKSLVGTSERFMGVDEFFARAYEYQEYASSAAVTRKFLEESGDTFYWLRDDIGVEFLDFGMAGYAHIYAGGDENMRNCGRGAIKTEYAVAKERGIEFIFEAPAKKVLIEDGKVVGLIAAEDPANAVQINCKAVIIATGGYTASRKVFNMFTHVNYDLIADAGVPGRDGDGILMGIDAGAALHLPSAVNYAAPTMRGEPEEGVPHTITCNQFPCIWVNEAGIRFTNEEKVQDWTKSGNALANEHQPFSIVDTAFFEHIMEDGLWSGATGIGTEALKVGVPKPNVYEECEMERKLNEDDPVAFKADTIEELAEKCGIDPVGLVETIERYNKACEEGKDPYGKSPEYLYPISKPPFYAFKMQILVMGTCGGIKIDDRMRALSAENNHVIPGLYVVGSDAGGFFGYYYDYALAPGSMNGWCVTSGRLAGADAAAYVQA
ncbi:MAG: FAD-binding protein [Coriobacteriales bacterium]|nr:FAD-binding protein [Coriobacteriales bacterium]